MGLESVEIGFVLSAFVVGVLILIVYVGLNHGILRKSLLSILKDKKGYYSLTKFQFLCWTIVFLFSLLWVYLVRIQGGVFTPIDFLKQPGNTLALMGINTASALGGSAIKIKPAKNQRKDFWGVLYSEDTHNPDLTRAQFLIWTAVSILIYVAILVGQMVGPYFGLSPIVSLTMLKIPDIDPSLVTLMGLSHVGYVGGKYVQSKHQ